MKPVGRAFGIVLGNLRHHKYGNGLTTVTASVQKRCLDEYNSKPVALITGGGNRYWSWHCASARIFLPRGYLRGVARSHWNRVTAETGGLSIVGDTSREEDVERIVAATISRFGRLDALILNAGALLSQLAQRRCPWPNGERNSTSTSQVRSW